MRILIFLTDAYGRTGGIAQYNRDLLQSLVAMPEIEEIVVLPRHVSPVTQGLSPKLRYYSQAAGGKLRYIRTAISVMGENFDLVICGHINLLVLARFISFRFHAPMVLQIHGIDAFEPHPSWLVRRLLAAVDHIWSVSEFTREKMIAWSHLPKNKFTILPNTIHLDHFQPGARNPVLQKRYNLAGCKVILLLGRLSASERYKGVDEVLEAMPQLLVSEPHLKFLVAGDGDDRPRLQEKASRLGLSKSVVFTGHLADKDKVDMFRLADAFVMPGHKEGFGIVFLEALACGIPAVGSMTDGSREALRGGMLGCLVDPQDQASLIAAILKQINAPKTVPPGLSCFAYPEFESRIAKAVRALWVNR